MQYDNFQEPPLKNALTKRSLKKLNEYGLVINLWRDVIKSSTNCSPTPWIWPRIAVLTSSTLFVSITSPLYILEHIYKCAKQTRLVKWEPKIFLANSILITCPTQMHKVSTCNPCSFIFDLFSQTVFCQENPALC